MDLDALLEEKPKTELSSDEKKKLVKTVEDELHLFDQFFQDPIHAGGCGNGPMTRPEKAILRTYLLARLTARFPSVLEDPQTSSA